MKKKKKKKKSVPDMLIKDKSDYTYNEFTHSYLCKNY